MNSVKLQVCENIIDPIRKYVYGQMYNQVMNNQDESIVEVKFKVTNEVYRQASKIKIDIMNQLCDDNNKGHHRDE